MATTRKTYVPLENNPKVLTELIHALGASPSLAFHDVYDLPTINDPITYIPHPIHALVVTIHSPVYHKARANEPSIPYQKSGLGPEAEPVLWFKQTIGHACGSMAALHALANSSARSDILPGSPLDKLFIEAVPLGIEERAQIVYDSPELEAAHRHAAQLGDSIPPSAEAKNYNHFIAFVRDTKEGHLWELEGGWSGPLDRGKMEDGEDVLSPRAVDLALGRFLEVAKEIGDIDFSLTVLAGAASTELR